MKAKKKRENNEKAQKVLSEQAKEFKRVICLKQLDEHHRASPQKKKRGKRPKPKECRPEELPSPTQNNHPQTGDRQSCEDLNGSLELVLPAEQELSPDLAESPVSALLVEYVPVATSMEQQGRTGPEGGRFKVGNDTASVVGYAQKLFECSMNHGANVSGVVNEPLVQSPTDTLMRIQESEIGTFNVTRFLNEKTFVGAPVYLELERQREETMEGRTNAHMIEAEHIHCKMIFDTINEIYNKYRPCGLLGAPLPWSHRQRPLERHLITPQGVARDVLVELEESSIMQMGVIPTDEMIVFNGTLDQELIDTQRGESIRKALVEDLKTSEKKWVDYEFEDGQVKIDVSDMILEQVIIEVIDIFS